MPTALVAVTVKVYITQVERPVTVIGEPEHRNRGATTDVFVPVLDFLFDTVGIERVKASILLRNQLTLRYLLKLGWQKDETPGTPVSVVRPLVTT